MNSYPVVTALFAAAFVPFATAQTSPGTPRYVTLPYHSSLTVGTSVGTGASVPTIPMWQATDAGYTFQMVGANPMITGSNSTTAIPTNIIPLILTFSDGNVFDPTVTNACSPTASAQSLVLASPLLNNSAYTSGTVSGGTTQYIDFFQRAAFWRYTGPSGINPNYHVLLSPLPGAAVQVSVPAASGRTVQTGCGRLGEMDINWFDEYVDNTLIPQLAGAGVAPNTYPVFVLNNTVMYDTSTSNCCIIGYHSASNNPSYSNQVQTYTVADFDTSGSFGSNRDTAALSHEVGEWLNDPLGNNPTPSWGHLGQVSGCQSNLEVGDPLSGTEVTVVMPNAYSYHVQEMAFKSWFYRDVPSSGVNGWYSSNGTFKTPAAACDSSVTTLAISPTTIAAGSTASVTVTVAAGSGYSGTPSGTVALVSGATHSTIATLTLSAGHASGAVAFPAGSYNVTANYSGDPNFAVSSSAAVAMTVGSPAINLNPASLTFGSQNTGTVSAAQSVVLTNQGTAPVTMSSVSITGSNPSDFAQTNNCGTSVAVGGSCTISVTFKPTAAGTRGASLSIADNVAGSPQTAPLTGTGTSTSVVSTVVFVKSDTTTQGNWHGIYGADGYNVIGDLASNPSYAAPVPASQFSYTWSASTSDGRALQKASNPSDRIAATWYSGSSFTIDLNTTDQASHQVALYCLDWDSNGRRETVDVLDPSGAVLNTQTLNSGFAGGVYLVWNISGRVILRVTNTAGGSNAVVSGLFFGSAAPIVPATGTATFVRTDTATQGNWRSTYGKDGYSVIGDTAVNPAYVTPLPSGQYSYTWAASTGDPRALQKASNPADRIAATWYTGGSFTVDLNITDGQTHQLAVYSLDWDHTTRQQTLDLLDGAGNVLNSQPASNFNGGVYHVWNVSGHVVLRVTNTQPGLNAVISGLFFGGTVAAPPPPVAATAAFVHADSTTHGNWHGVYGADGYSVQGDASLNPSYASPVFTGSYTYTWNPSTADARALQKPSDLTDRIAATWYSGTSFSIATNISDTATHQVAIYCLDWDSTTRQQTVDVLDASGAVLNTQTLTGNFNGGVYLVWNVSGPVTFRVTNSGINAVVSGLFFR